MSNSKYDAYLKIGAALKNGDEKKSVRYSQNYYKE